MKRLFRYGYSTICVIVGLVISFFVFQYYGGAKKIDSNENADRENYNYNYEMSFFMQGALFSLDEINYEALADCDISIINQSIYFDEAAGSYMTDIIVDGEVSIYPIISGRYPNSDELSSGMRCAVLGKKMKKYTVRRNGEDYISICGDEYLVTGYISAENSGIFDFRTILYYGCLGDGVYEDLNYFKAVAGWSILIQSNTVTPLDMTEALKPNLESESYYMMADAQVGHFTASNAVSKENKSFAVIVYVFSLFTVVLVVEYWLICRRREFAIRKAYGYFNGRILGRVFGELIVCVIISIVFSELLLVLLNIVEKEAVVFAISNMSDRLLCIAKYIFITLIILIIRPAVKIFKDNPIKLLVNKEN